MTSDGECKGNLNHNRDKYCQLFGRILNKELIYLQRFQWFPLFYTSDTGRYTPQVVALKEKFFVVLDRAYLKSFTNHIVYPLVLIIKSINH